MKSFKRQKSSKLDVEEQFQVRYLDLSRLIDVNDWKRFEQLAARVDINTIQLGNKPFIYSAILKNEIQLVAFLLSQEIDLTSKYTVELNTGGSEDNEPIALVDFEPIEYAAYLQRDEIYRLIRQKMDGPELEQRWMNLIETLNVINIDAFASKFKHAAHGKELMELGLVKAAQLGSHNLIDYFLGDCKVDVNCICIVDGIIVTPLLQAIAYRRKEAVKYLIFRKANIHIEGEFGDTLVTAVHYESPVELITLILEKGANLASRHKHWPAINLREYCVQLNKVDAKAAIDNFVFRLIANGEYDKLKRLADSGYLNINVTNRLRKTGRDVACERNHSNIIQLIDRIEFKQKRLKTKMNY